jgi:hypothetical protein
MRHRLPDTSFSSMLGTAAEVPSLSRSGKHTARQAYHPQNSHDQSAICMVLHACGTFTTALQLPCTTFGTLPDMQRLLYAMGRC